MELDDEEEPEPEVKPKSKPKKPVSAANGTSKSPAKTRGVATSKQTRGAQREQIESTTAQRIKVHQSELHAHRKAAGLKKWANGGKGGDEGRNKVIKKFESYKREEQLPSIVQERRIYVDEHRQSIILPINGFATPFHISTVKNVSKIEESEHIALRINFQSPGQIAGKKEDMVGFSGAQACTNMQALRGPRRNVRALPHVQVQGPPPHDEGVRLDHCFEEGCDQARGGAQGNGRRH